MLFCAQAVYHSHNQKRLEALWKLGDLVPGGIAKIRFKLDTCTTRAMLSRTYELHSIFRLNKALKVAAATNSKASFLVGQDWKDMAEVESVLNEVGPVLLLVQSEHLFLGGMAAACVSRVIFKLKNGKLRVVDLDAVSPRHGTKTLPFIRTKQLAADFGPIGKEAHRRAVVEVERRFCGSTSEDVTNAEYRMTERQQMAAVLDIRCIVSPDIPASQKRLGVQLLRVEYISFAGRKEAHERSLVAQPVLVPHDEADEDDDDDDGGLEWLGTEQRAVTPKEVVREEDLDWAAKYGPEFDRAYSELAQYASKLDWKRHFAELRTDDFSGIKKFDAVDHLLHLDMGPHYRQMEAEPKFGLLPVMARASRASIAALPAESFCERIISAGNKVLTKDNIRADQGHTRALVRFSSIQRQRGDTLYASRCFFPFELVLTQYDMEIVFNALGNIKRFPYTL